MPIISFSLSKTLIDIISKRAKKDYRGNASLALEKMLEECKG